MFDLSRYIEDAISDAIGEDDLKEAVDDIIDGIDFLDYLKENDTLQAAVYEKVEKSVRNTVDMYL